MPTTREKNKAIADIAIRFVFRCATLLMLGFSGCVGSGNAEDLNADSAADVLLGQATGVATSIGNRIEVNELAAGERRFLRFYAPQGARAAAQIAGDATLSAQFSQNRGFGPRTEHAQRIYLESAPFAEEGIHLLTVRNISPPDAHPAVVTIVLSCVDEPTSCRKACSTDQMCGDGFCREGFCAAR